MLQALRRPFYCHHFRTGHGEYKSRNFSGTQCDGFSFELPMDHRTTCPQLVPECGSGGRRGKTLNPIFTPSITGLLPNFPLSPSSPLNVHTQQPQPCACTERGGGGRTENSNPPPMYIHTTICPVHICDISS